ncbi:MAG: hypothetical protein QNJ57_01515 [Flavobacteriaceae bacterium]|nr:hypothetical protein [Flavobacteriaceae bacterium]
MSNLLIYGALLIICSVKTATAQSNNLSSSPYSLFGLGVPSDISVGKTNAFGKSGLALPFENSINGLNPAAYGGILSNRFLYDLGAKFETETLIEDGNEEGQVNGNFSNIAIAFPITRRSGLGITLIPFTNVGYEVLGIESSINGSSESFLANITGSGGLNDLKLNYGHSFSKKLRLGLGISYLFGKIEEEEIDLIGGSLLSIREESYYNGFRFTPGFQYDLTKNISIGGIVNLPSELDGSQTRTVAVNALEPEESESELDAFKLPLEASLGVYVRFNEKLSFTLDYKRSFWDETDQNDQIGDFVDQDFVGLGLEYTPKVKGLAYWQRINYRLGFNYDNGNLVIDGNKISNTAINFGFGLPISERNNSMLNLHYSYGQRGLVSNGLIKENYHILTFNISLEDLWFVKRKLN